METTINWQALSAIIIAVATVATGYGLLRGRVKQNEKATEELTDEWQAFHGANPGGIPRYIRPDQCEERVTAMSKSIDNINQTVQGHGSSLKGLKNFARYQLQKEGLDLAAVNKILNGDG